MLPRFSPSISTTDIECCWCNKAHICSGETKFQEWLNRKINYSCNWFTKKDWSKSVDKHKERTS